MIASLENDVFPFIGAMPIADIKAPVLLNMLRKIEARGVRDTTKRILQRVRAVFQYGILYGACDRNPAADIDSATALKARRLCARRACPRSSCRSCCAASTLTRATP